MKKTLYTIGIIAAIVASPFLASAISVSWNKITAGQIYPPSTTDKVAVGTTTPYANLTVWGNASGNAFEIANSASTTILSVSNTGFGTTTLAGLNIAGSATSTSNVGFNITSGCYAKNGTCLTQNVGTVTSVGLSDSNSSLTIGNSPITSSGNITATLNLGHQNDWTALQTFTNASSTLFSSTYSSSTNYVAGDVKIPHLGTAAGTFLAADATGKVIATSTPSSGSPFTMGYASTTITSYWQVTATMTSGQKIYIWANNGNTSSGTQPQYHLYIKPPNNATTTLDTQILGDGAGRNQNISFLGFWTATSTGDYYISMDNLASGSQQANIMYMITN